MTVFAERTLTLTRVLKAPRDLVWKAWTDHAQLKEWWGPEGFTNPVVEGDIHVGGTLNITMHGPKDTPFDMDFPMVKRYREIVPGKKLVFENEPLGDGGERLMDSLTTVTRGADGSVSETPASDTLRGIFETSIASKKI